MAQGISRPRNISPALTVNIIKHFIVEKKEAEIFASFLYVQCSDVHCQSDSLHYAKKLNFNHCQSSALRYAHRRAKKTKSAVLTAHSRLVKLGFRERICFLRR